MGSKNPIGKVKTNQAFKFKQFDVEQGQCAMKVGTLSCILGAYAFHPNPAHILDIGTGTGVLALMLAQRYGSAAIDAVEIDEPACRQASTNFKTSPWSSRMLVHHCDIEKFHSKHTGAYDLVISNPPFFERHYQSPDPKVNLARHDGAMTAPKLMQAVLKLLHPAGYFFVLLPEAEMKRFTLMAGEHQLNAFCELRIYNFKNEKVKALIRGFMFGPSVLKSEELIVWSGINHYSEQFIKMHKAYYLHF